MEKIDRPLWPPGAELTAQAFDAFAAWESKWSEELEEFPSIDQRTAIYDYMLDGIDIDLAKSMAKMDAECASQLDSAARSAYAST